MIFCAFRANMCTTERENKKMEVHTMKQNIFEEVYEQEQKIRKAYNEAQDEVGKEKARIDHRVLMGCIEGLGEAACRIWREYETARENGNARLDISEVVWDKDVEDLIACMRENGISEFTFSSTWISAVETAWSFTQNGCELGGLVEINGGRDHFTGEHEKKHGYLFKVN